MLPRQIPRPASLGVGLTALKLVVARLATKRRPFASPQTALLPERLRLSQVEVGAEGKEGLLALGPRRLLASLK